jgi:hypothetical protein
MELHEMADDDLELKLGRIGDGGRACKTTAQKHFALPAALVHVLYANTATSSRAPHAAEPALACGAAAPG